MADYNVGQLDALFSSTRSKAEKTSSSLTSLFVPRVEKKQPKRKPDEKDAEETSSKGAPPKKAKKEEDPEEEENVFTTPSRKFQVREEDSKQRKLDPEKESRTVFVGNLPCKVTVKAIRKRFHEFGEIETVRLRGAARPDELTTKKVAVIMKKFHDSRQNINAYVRFKIREDAMKSCSLNGSEFSSRVIRVDLASGEGGAPASKRNQSKAVFLGNLSFKVEEDEVRRHFARCGAITDVRLVRDASSGMGKGFGYVNFAEADSVELALKLNGSRLGQREVRVSRATPNSKKESGKKKPVVKRVPKNAAKEKRKKKPQAPPTSNFQGRVGLKKSDMGKHAKKRVGKEQKRRTKAGKVTKKSAAKAK